MKRIDSRLYIFFLLPFLTTLTFAQNINTERYTVEADSKLSIEGKSSVNDFSCILEDTISEDTLQFNTEVIDDEVFISGDSISLTINRFDCGKKGINRDFRKTLKSDVYPSIKLALLNLKIDDDMQLPSLRAEVEIQIAGVKHIMELSFDNIEQNGKQTVVSGSKVLKMSDFELHPPSPLFGLIKVDDTLTIYFDLVISKA